MDFIKDLRKIAETILDHYGLICSATEDIEVILRRWVNMQLKLITPVPRKVFCSPKIQSISLQPNEKQSLDVIKTKLENGADVNGYMSKNIFQEDHTDYLFSDWGIYHFHLNIEQDPTNPYFIKRSDNLLFLMLRKESAYLIDVRVHDEDYVFAQKELLKIVHDTWPEIIELYRLKGIFIEKEYSNEEVHELRKAGVMIIQKIGNDSYVPPGGGITTAATAVNVTTQTDWLLEITRNAENWAKNNTQTLLQEIQKLNPHQTTMDLHLDLNDNGYFVVDLISKIAWKIKG